VREWRRGRDCLPQPGYDVSLERWPKVSLLLVPFRLVFAAGLGAASWNPGLRSACWGPSPSSATCSLSWSAAQMAGLAPGLSHSAVRYALSSGIDRTGLLTMIAIIIVGFGAVDTSHGAPRRGRLMRVTD